MVSKSSGFVGFRRNRHAYSKWDAEDVEGSIKPLESRVRSSFHQDRV